MIRFVLGPDGAVVPDLLARLPGRGIWLSARRDVLDSARAPGGNPGGKPGSLARAFARAARGHVTVPADLPSVLQTALVRRIGELLGLARRAGQAVAGFERAREWLRTGRAGLVVQAADGSAGECARFLSGVGDVAVVMPLDGAALGAVFGRPHVVHVAVAPGRLAAALADESSRLSGLTGQPNAAGGDAGEPSRQMPAEKRAGA